MVQYVCTRRQVASTWLLLLCASVALLLGGAIYFFMRPLPMVMEAVGFQSISRISVHGHIESFFGSLPSLLHVYAFSLFTVASLENKTACSIRTTILLWIFVNLLFEFGQVSSLKAFWSEYSHAGAITPLANYFLFGTFDWTDAGFSAIGGVVAYFNVYGRKS